MGIAGWLPAFAGMTLKECGDDMMKGAELLDETFIDKASGYLLFVST